MDETRSIREELNQGVTVFRFVIMAWLPGESYVKRLAMSGEDVLAFDTEQKAMRYYADNMTPDWECEIIPMATLSMATDTEQQDALVRIGRRVMRDDANRERQLAEDSQKANCESCLSDYTEIGKPCFEDQICHVLCRCEKCGSQYWRLYDSYQVIFPQDRETVGLNLEQVKDSDQ